MGVTAIFSFILFYSYFYYFLSPFLCVMYACGNAYERPHVCGGQRRTLGLRLFYSLSHCQDKVSLNLESHWPSASFRHPRVCVFPNPWPSAGLHTHTAMPRFLSDRDLNSGHMLSQQALFPLSRLRHLLRAPSRGPAGHFGTCHSVQWSG